MSELLTEKAKYLISRTKGRKLILQAIAHCESQLGNGSEERRHKIQDIKMYYRKAIQKQKCYKIN